MKLIVVNLFIHLFKIIPLISSQFNLNSTTNEMLKISTNDWHKMTSENRPPTNDDYLYVTGPNARMNIIYTNPPKPSCETCGIEISLRFWANWNKTKFSVIKEGTELFRLAVMPCHRSMPATKFILFSDFDPSTWNYFVYTASKQADFNFKCDKKVEIEIADNEDYQAKIKPEDEYLIAIKDLRMKYYCVMQTAESLLSNETCSGSASEQSTIRCIDVTCDKRNCPDSFSIQGGSWSPDNLPDRVAEYQDFWYSNENRNKLNITLTEPDDDSIACVKIGYWITGNSYLTIEIGETIINLDNTKMDQIDGNPIGYAWESIVLCPSRFAQRSDGQSGQSELKLTSHFSKSDDLIAVSLKYQIDNESHYATINNYLHHFSRPEAQNEWSILPTNLHAGQVNTSQPFAIELTFPAKSGGNGYIFSRWFKYSPGLKFRGTVKSDNLFGVFSATLSLHESNGRRVQSYNLFSIISDSSGTQLNQRLGVTLDATNSVMVNVKKSTICFIMINITFNSTKQSELTLGDVDVGDGCRESELACMGHGECINMEPDQYQCLCDQGWTGSHCALINFCETVNSETGLTGNQYCEISMGKCNPLVFAPFSPVCDCDKMRYWVLTIPDLLSSNKLHGVVGYNNKTSSYSTGHCELVSKCVGLTDLCPVGYACDEDYWSSDRPCQICNRMAGYTMFDGQCVKVDACYKKCGKAKCSSFGVHYYCYCEDGQELGDDGKSCKPRSKCTVWDSQQLKCSHGCEIVNGAPKCSCHQDYTLLDDGKSCQANFNCTVTCPEGSICQQVGENSPTTCTCPVGWDWDELSSKCIDICKLADRGHLGWRNYIHDACGGNRCNVINGEIRCICTPPTITNKSGLCELEKICFPDNRGYFDCNGRNALCEPRSDGVTFTYRCLCPPGKAFEDGVCVDQCTSKMYECAAMNAVCRIIEDESTEAHKATCKCRPGFIMENNYCFLAKHSIKATFTIKLIDTKLSSYASTLDNLWESFCSNMDIKFLHDCQLYTHGVLGHWIKMVIETQLDRIVARYVDSILDPNIRKFADSNIDSVTLIGYEKDLNSLPKNAKSPEQFDVPAYRSIWTSNADFNITVSLQMKNNAIRQDSLLRMLCNDVFNSDDPRHDYCLIPSQTLIRKGTIEESDLIPCSEQTIDYCPKDTTCISDHDETKFKCSCNPGYMPQAIIKLDKTNLELTKQYCVDINECALGQTLCPGHSNCVNTRGSYKCECESGWINDGIQCRELCEYKACQHGECEIIGNHTAICRCDFWYTGDRCETINKVASFWKTMTIIVATSLSSILIIFIVTSIVVARRSKSTAVENGYLKNRIELTDSMYMQNIRPSLRSMAGRRGPISSNFDLQMR